MRALSAPVVLSSIALAGWLSGAMAQDVGIAPPGSTPSPNEQTGSENLPPGVIPQPTPDNPGLVTGVTLGELYTDNLKLAASGASKQSSWITVIQPFVRSAASGPRFSGIFDYKLTGYVYEGGSNHDQLAQDLHAQGTLAVVPQHLFLDGTATYGREIINNELPAGQGTFFLNNNQANVATASLSPYWIQDVGNVGTMSLRYTRGRVVYNRRGIPDQNGALLTGVPDVTSNSVQFSLVGPKYEAWGWNVGYTEQRLSRGFAPQAVNSTPPSNLDGGFEQPSNPDFGRSSDFAMAQAGISRQINPSTRLLADAGKENKYLPDGSYQHLGATFWDAGFEWASTQDSFKLLVGHRFYGHSGQLSWTHTAALLTTTVEYVEKPTDLNQQLLGQNPGEIAITPIGTPQIPSLIESRVYLMKRASAVATYEMPKGQLSLTLYDESRKYFELDNAREKVENANLAWLFDWGPFTTFTPTVGWQRYQFRDGQINNTRYVQLALVHQINPDNFGSLRLRNDSRSAYEVLQGAHGYRVNVIYFEWTHLF